METLAPNVLGRRHLHLFCAGVVVLLTVFAPLPAWAVSELEAVRDCGAVPDDGRVDTKALQACLYRLSENGGGILKLPLGLFEIEHSGRSVALYLPSDVTLQGAGPATIIKLRRPSNGFSETRMLATKGTRTTNVFVRDLTLDGGRGEKSCAETKHHPVNPPRGKGEQQHAIFFGDVHHAGIVHVHFQKLSGDALYIYRTSHDIRIEHEVITGYCRAGITINSGGALPPPNHIRIIGNRFRQDKSYPGTVHARAIDIEAHAQQVEIRDNDLDELQGGALEKSRVVNNYFYGEGIALIGASDVLVDGNWLAREDNEDIAAMLLVRRSHDIVVRDNIVVASSNARAGIEVLNNSDYLGRNIRVEENIVFRRPTPAVSTSLPKGRGIMLYGIDTNVVVRHNLVRGAWRIGMSVDGGSNIRIAGNHLEGATALSLTGTRPGFPLSLREGIVAERNTLVGVDDAIVGNCFPTKEGEIESCQASVRFANNRISGASRKRLGGIVKSPDAPLDAMKSERSKPAQKDVSDDDKRGDEGKDRKKSKRRRRRR